MVSIVCVCAYVYLCILVREIHAQLFRHVLRPEVIIRMSFSVTSSPYFVWVLLCVCVSVSHTLYGCSCLKFYMYFSVQWELSHWWRRIPVLACRYHHHHLPCKSSNSCDPPPPSFLCEWSWWKSLFFLVGDSSSFRNTAPGAFTLEMSWFII